MFIKIALAIGCVVFYSDSFAGISDIQASNSQITVQAISTNVDYTETDYGKYDGVTGILDTESGKVPGYAVSISKMQDVWSRNDYFEAEYSHSYGSTSYVGGYVGPPPTPYGSVVATSGAALINYSARYGQGYDLNRVVMLTPYAEIGFHEWDRGVNSGEIYTHYYFGIGALGQYSPFKKLVVSLNAMLGTMTGAHIVVNSVPAAGFPGFNGDLPNSALYKVSLSADFRITQNFHVNSGIDYMSFKYNISDLYPVGGNYVAWEPDSETNYTTVKFGCGYSF